MQTAWGRSRLVVLKKSKKTNVAGTECIVGDVREVSQGAQPV